MDGSISMVDTTCILTVSVTQDLELVESHRHDVSERTLGNFQGKQEKSVNMM